LTSRTFRTVRFHPATSTSSPGLVTRVRNWVTERWKSPFQVGRCFCNGIYGILFTLFAIMIIFGALWYNFNMVIHSQPVIGVFLPISKYSLEELRSVVDGTNFILVKTSTNYLITSRKLIGATSIDIFDSLRHSLQEIADYHHASILFQEVGEAWYP